MIASQSTGERKRTHDHYLKGSLFCGRCFDTDGTVGWMIMANVRGRGGDYQYFFCRRRQEHLCDAPYIQLPRLEDAVVRFWQRQQVTEAFSKALREGIHRTVDNDQRATRSLHKQVSTNLKKLDTQEQNLLDLAADGIGSIVWATGFHPDFSMIKLPVFDVGGHPLQNAGGSPHPGLYFVGFPWMPAYRTGTLPGFGGLAQSIAERICTRRTDAMRGAA